MGLDPIGALANLQLGRVYTLSGDNVKAKSAYESFLKLWKDADADIPILKEAKTEYAKLKCTRNSGSPGIEPPASVKRMHSATQLRYSDLRKATWSVVTRLTRTFLIRGSP